MSKKTIVISEADRKELLGLYRKAQTTPIIGFSCRDMIEGKDFASLAWGEVRAKMDELGQKYGFNPKEMKGIDGQTGEVLL